MANKRSELIGVIGAKTSGFKKGMGKLGGIAKTAMKGVAVAFTVAFAAAAAGLAGFAKLVKDVAGVADELQKLSLASGISVKALQAIKFAAEQSGSNIDKFAKGIFNMQRNLSEAKQGTSTFVSLFNRLGVSIGALSKMSPEKQLTTIIRALSDMEDVTERNAISMELFGAKVGKDMVAAAAAGGQAFDDLIRKGGELTTITTEQADAAARFNDSLNEVKTAMDGVENKVVLSFLQSFGDELAGISGKIANFRKENGFTTWIATAMGFINELVATFRKSFATIKSVVNTVFDVLMDTAILMQSTVAYVVVGLFSDIVEVAQSTMNTLINMMNAIPGVNIKLIDSEFVKDMIEIESRIKQAQDHTLDRLKNQTGVTEGIVALNEDLAKIEADRLATETNIAKFQNQAIDNEIEKGAAQKENATEAAAAAERAAAAAVELSAIEKKAAAEKAAAGKAATAAAMELSAIEKKAAAEKEASSKAAAAADRVREDEKRRQIEVTRKLEDAAISNQVAAIKQRGDFERASTERLQEGVNKILETNSIRQVGRVMDRTMSARMNVDDRREIEELQRQFGPDAVRQAFASATTAASVPAVSGGTVGELSPAQQVAAVKSPAQQAATAATGNKLLLRTVAEIGKHTMIIQAKVDKMAGLTGN